MPERLSDARMIVMEAKLLVAVGFSFVYDGICDFQQEMFEYLIKI
jgi:hypothetical protein